MVKKYLLRHIKRYRIYQIMRSVDIKNNHINLENKEQVVFITMIR